MSTLNPKNMRYAWRRLVVRDPHLTDATRRVLLELESYSNPDGTNAHPGIDRLATLPTKTGTVNEKTVRRALTTGIKRGYIECTHKSRGGRAGNDADVYRLTLPEEAERPDCSVDADPFDTGDPEPVVQPQDHNQTDETVDTQVSGVHPETADTQMPSVHEESADISSTSGGHFESNTGHPDVHLPDLLHQTTNHEGTSEMTNSFAEPIHSDNAPAQSAPIQLPPPSADDRPPMPTAEHGLSRYCEKHPNGTPHSCPACGDNRRAVEEAEAVIKRATEQRSTADSKARREAAWRAVEACSMCDKDGYRNRRICNHRPEQDRINAEGKAEVQAAIAAARRKREEKGQRIRVDTAGRPIRRTAKSVPRQAVRSFRSGDDTGRAASRAELGRLKPAPMLTGLAPDSAVQAGRALQASVA